jgi:hypothetical protein
LARGLLNAPFDEKHMRDVVVGYSGMTKNGIGQFSASKRICSFVSSSCLLSKSILLFVAHQKLSKLSVERKHSLKIVWANGELFNLDLMVRIKVAE